MDEKIRPDGYYITVTKESALRDIVTIIEDNYDSFSIDTETTGIDSLNDKLIGISLSYKEGWGYYIPVQEGYSLVVQRNIFNLANEYLDLEVIIKHLNKITSSNKIKYMHNAKYDIHILERHGFTLNQPIYDTMLGSYVLGNVYGAKYGLKELTKRKLGFDMYEFKEVAGKNPFFTVPIELATKYAAADTDMTLRLANLVQKRFESFPNLKFTEELEMKTMPVIARMETAGVLVNTDELRRISSVMTKEINDITPKIFEEFGGKFNINSEEELKKALKLRYNIHTEKVDEKTLLSFSERIPIVTDIINYRKRLKFKSVYADGIQKLADNNHRVHTEYYQMLKTGRLSSKNPNLQNIPGEKDDSDLPLLRRAFIASPGYKFLSIDYSQLELRVITHVAKEQYWIDAFANNVDIHLATACAVLKKLPEEITKYERKKAKFTNFGLLYGESAYGLSNRTGMTLDEARQFIEDYFSVLPNVKEYVEEIKRQVMGRRYTETFMGRRLYYSYDPLDAKAVAASIREATNHPIQGGAADIVKQAMYEVDKYLTSYKSFMTLQVHDEICFEAHEDELHIICPAIKEIMENVFKLDVDLKVDLEMGDNWNDAKEFIW